MTEQKTYYSSVPITEEQALKLGFKKLSHFTVMGSLIYDLGRRRHLSLGCVGTPNEMIFICESDKDNPDVINDLICLHNFDYDGLLSEEKLRSIISAFYPTAPLPSLPHTGETAEFKTADDIVEENFKGLQDAGLDVELIDWYKALIITCMEEYRSQPSPVLLLPPSDDAIADEQYIEVYNKLGNKHYSKGSDQELKEWGNSDERIREIKIECVKSELKWHKKGIETYKLLNGTNSFLMPREGESK